MDSGELRTELTERVARDRRLLNEFVELNSTMLRFLSKKPRTLDFEVSELPGIVGLSDSGKPELKREHKLRLLLPDDYPLGQPQLVPLTGVFHPNICIEGGNPDVCYTENWNAGMANPLSWVIGQYVKMVQYEDYNLQEPHRGLNRKASDWVESLGKEAYKLFPLKPMARLRFPDRETVDLKDRESND